MGRIKQRLPRGEETLRFGYETLGTWGIRGISRVIAGSIFTPTSSGEGQSITIGLKQILGDWSGKIKCAIYLNSDYTLLANGVTEERSIDLTDTPTWYVFNFLGTKPIISAAVAYVLVGWAEGPFDLVRAILVMDYEDVKGLDHPQVYNSFPSPFGFAKNSDLSSIYCEYKRKEVIGMTVIFLGTVSAQESAGEVVTITVTLPGGGTEKVSTPTLADKSFSIEYTNVPGDYTAKAKIEADSLYEAAESAVVPFVIGKEPRTITLLVTPK